LRQKNGGKREMKLKTERKALSSALGIVSRALAAVETPTVQMSFNSAKNPVLIRPTGEDSGFLHVLMPMNIP
jgi:DNA polymerase III sliding clamp (beta) subunit (PCNA family)